MQEEGGKRVYICTEEEASGEICAFTRRNGSRNFEVRKAMGLDGDMHMKTV